MNKVRVAAVQFEHANGNKEKPGNDPEICDGSRAENVRIIAFPECCITGYWFLRNLSEQELLELAEPAFSGPSSLFLMELSQKYNMTIGAGLLEEDGGRMYNTYIVAMPNGEFRKHRKIHAFESDFIHEGDSLTVFDTPHGCKVGVLICYDNNIIENVRMTALLGAQIILAPTRPVAAAPMIPTSWGSSIWNCGGTGKRTRRP